MLLATVLAAVAVAPPSATTLPATDFAATGATLHGTIDPNGETTTYFFQYGTSTDYGLETGPATVDASGDVSVPVTGLTPNTTYHFRIFATNGSGEDPGADQTFRTTNPRPPEISGQAARNVRVNGATLSANLDPHGSETTYRFEYGTNTRYGRSTTVRTLAADAGRTAVEETLSGLRARTRYHWRLVATNAAGTGRGRDRSFTTARLPTGVSLGLSPRTVTWGRSLTLGGRVKGAGAAGMTVVLQVQPFPFGAAFAPVDTARTGRDGGYLFSVPDLWTTTRYRVATRTQVVATSPVVQANSAVLVGRHVRHSSRKRARIDGSVFPAGDGTATLQRRTRSGSWRRIRRQPLRPRDSVRSRYAFRVWRVQRVRRRYRVVVRPAAGDGHVTGKSRGVLVKPRRGR